MSASHIIKYIYNYGSDEVIRKGKKIFLTDGVKLIKKDELSNQLVFKVKNDQYYNQYTVTISKYLNESTIKARCLCPYNMGEVCRHEVAALFQLNEMLVNQTLDSTETQFNQLHTVVRMKSIDLHSLRLFTSSSLFEASEQMIKKNTSKIIKAENEIVEAIVEVDKEKFEVKLKRNDDKSFDTSCNCTESKYPLCKHKTAIFLLLLNKHGENYFDTIRNWDSQKNKLLGLYGYSLEDDLTGKFEFYYQDAKPFLKVLDASIKKVSVREPLRRAHEELKPVEKKEYTKHLGIVFNLQEKGYPYFTIDLVEGEMDMINQSFAGNINKLDISKYIDTDIYPVQDRELVSQVRKIQKIEVSKFIAKNSPFGDLWENITQNETELTLETKDLIYEFLHPKLLKLFNSLGDHNPIYVLPKGKPYKTASLEKLNYNASQLFPVIHIQKKKTDIHINVQYQVEERLFKMNENELDTHLIFMHKKELYLAPKAKDVSHVSVLDKFNKIKLTEWGSFLQEKLLPITKLYETKFDKGLIEYSNTVKPTFSVRLSEQGSYFILKPVFEYENVEAQWNEEENISINKEGKVLVIKRNKEIEAGYIQLIESLHSNLKKPEFENHFAIHSKYALQKNWFFLFFDKMKEEKIKLYGYETLKQFKINKSKPTTKVYISSNLDWFDTEIDITFGEESATISDIQKALKAKQNYVSLGDGSYGLLPEEWLQKFSLLFKMADTKDQTLKVSKYNFTVIDELHDLIDDEDIRIELEEKKQNLLSETPEKYSNIEIPEELNATLRPYQKAGFQWLAYLDTIKWGGLLADDMGLGKTIQTLTFLQYYKNKYGKLRAMVVCPTTLLFNWENEIKKFTPGISYLIQHGPTRTSRAEELDQYEIIISTYGTLRSDVEMLVKLEFDYVVLDESQTIKNPTSKVSKAAQLIPSKNRIALSGTPMQNNTFDMYSQMNFLNPGMLGTKEFFKEQFAKPIDKFQEVDTKQHLRKLIYPFLLRRTKEQVAKDLPEKTEVTLYCEMGKEQRAIYDMYRNMYRSQILGTIDNQGIEKSQFAILQGLMKLRQICDSPAILKEETKLPNHSVKIDELVRELEDNMGDHKALVFSQFLGMLGLIKEKLIEKNIPFQYFDGSFTAQQRENAIREFQDKDECKVFLISLKAGGMGLNLTSADYVYLVDPWWNPAVEQQAIDRTHRIGQTKNIFAYRLICKDTVEEKIMTLKDKKNSLVKDIVSDDTHMIKQLTKDDVSYLFS